MSSISEVDQVRAARIWSTAAATAAAKVAGSIPSVGREARLILITWEFYAFGFSLLFVVKT